MGYPLVSRHVSGKSHLDADRKPVERSHRLAVAFKIIIEKSRALEGLVEEYLRQTVGLYSPEPGSAFVHRYRRGGK